jgi:flagellar basal-body rod protein FlgB
MRFDLDNIFGVHANGMLVRAKRTEILANNLANADTPNFKARDIDFKQVLNQAQQSTGGMRMRTSHPRHLETGVNAGTGSAELLYRNPTQPSVDGNTVDTQAEKSQFIQNAIQYQASIRFLNGKISGLKTALRGE